MALWLETLMLTTLSQGISNVFLRHLEVTLKKLLKIKMNQLLRN